MVTPEFPPANYGGLARTASRVSGHLSAGGYDVHVVHAVVTGGIPPLLDENDRITRRGDIIIHEVSLGREGPFEKQRSLWNCPHTLTLVMLHEALEILFRREQFDIFLSFFLYPVGYVVGITAKKLQRPHISCVVGNDIKKYLFSPEKAFLCKSALDNSERIVFLSQDLMDTAQALTPVRDKAHIILNSVEPSKSRWKGPSLDPSFHLGCAAIFKHAKGLPYLLKALSAFSRTGPVILELTGELRPEEIPILEYWLDRTGVRTMVRRLGVIPHAEMPAWLSGLDVFVLPSISEGCPNVLMEAMSVGVPCVSSRIGATEILIEDGHSGLLVPWGDAEALTGALHKLRSDPQLAVSLGRAGRERMKLFSPEKERLEWTALFRGLGNCQ